MVHARVLKRAICLASALLVIGTAVRAQTSYGSHPVFRPPGNGRHPGMVFVSGCYGFNPAGSLDQDNRTAEDFRRHGFIVVFADYLADAQADSCEDLKPQDVEADVVAAAQWLHEQPDVDPAHITVIGWSFGGGVALAALSEPPRAPLPFSRVIVFYPDCSDVHPWPVAIPILMLQGAQDQIVSNSLCEMRAKRSAAPELVRIVVFPGAKHAFDFSAYAGYPSSRRGFAPDSTAAAWREVWKFLEGR